MQLSAVQRTPPDDVWSFPRAGLQCDAVQASSTYARPYIENKRLEIKRQDGTKQPRNLHEAVPAGKARCLHSVFGCDSLTRIAKKTLLLLIYRVVCGICVPVVVSC